MTIEKPNRDTETGGRTNLPGAVIPLRPHRDSRERRDSGTDLERRVFEGELLSDEENKALDRRLLGKALDRLTLLAPPARQATARVVRIMRESERPKQAGKGALRTALTVVQGVESWAKRAWDASTMGVYRRQIKAAEVTGNQELLAEWVERKEAASERRHDRLMELPGLLAGIARVVVGSVIGLVFLVLFIALLVQLSGKGEFTAVVGGVMNAVAWMFGAVAFVWTPFIMSVPMFVLLAA